MPDYFTLAELRGLPQVGDTAKFPDARCNAVASAIEGVIDREVFGSPDVGFVARTVTETLDGNNRASLLLRTPHVRSLTSVTVDGVAVDVADLSAAHGVLRYTTSGCWARGVANVVVVYVAGYGTDDTVPGDVKEAALQGTRYRLLQTAPNSELNERQTSMTNDLGGTTSFAVAGTDHPTGYPTVDATLVAWRRLLNTVTYP